MGALVKSDPVPDYMQMQTDLAKDRRLTLMQIKFVREYMANGGNGKAAAIAAGYSQKAAETLATKNLANPLILKEIDRLTKHALERAEVTFDWKVHQLKKMIYKCISGDGLKGGFADPAGLVACIGELNKMQGDLKIDTQNHQHIHAHANLQEVEKLMKKYRKEF